MGEFGIFLSENAEDSLVGHLQVAQVTHAFHFSKAVAVDLYEHIVHDRVHFSSKPSAQAGPDFSEVSSVGFNVILVFSQELGVLEVDGLGFFNLLVGVLDEVGHEETFLEEAVEHQLMVFGPGA
jgi:hypothetical protein